MSGCVPLKSPPLHEEWAVWLALTLGGAGEAGEESLTRNADDLGRMQGEEESWGR